LTEILNVFRFGGFDKCDAGFGLRDLTRGAGFFEGCKGKLVLIEQKNAATKSSRHFLFSSQFVN
jgi:hypothetical protein